MSSDEYSEDEPDVNVFDWQDDELASSMILNGESSAGNDSVEIDKKKALDFISRSQKPIPQEPENEHLCDESFTKPEEKSPQTSIHSDDEHNIRCQSKQDHVDSSDSMSVKSLKSAKLIEKGKLEMAHISSTMKQLFTKPYTPSRKPTNRDKHHPDIMNKVPDRKIFKSISKTNFSNVASGIDEVIKNIIHNKPYYLGNFRSVEQKEKLLSAAVKTHHTTCILKVVLFIETTLRRDKFVKLIQNHPKAINEYNFYLKQVGRADDRIFSGMLESKRDKLLSDFYDITVTPSNAARNKLLDKIIKHNLNDESLKFYVDVFKDYKNVHNLQIHLLDSSSSDNPFIITNDVNLFNLAAYSIYQQMSKNTIPRSLQMEFKLNDKQFEWLLVKIVTATKMYENIMRIFPPVKNAIFKSTKFHSHMSFEVISRYLHLNNAPDEVICDVIMQIPDKENRLAIAETCAQYDLMINLIVNLKDKTQLLEKFSQIEDLNFRTKVAKLLDDKSIKWKN